VVSVTRSIGEVLPGGYVLGDEIGSGGMGVVHSAHTPHGRSVVVKLVDQEHANDSYSIACLQREMQAGRSVKHPNVVSMIDALDAGPDSFVIMEHVRGELLGDMIKRDHDIPLATVLAIGREILYGLAAMHDARIVHADIKSDNVIVDTDLDGGLHVKIIDLGLARTMGEEMSDHDLGGRTTMSGTPEYMAPELRQGGRATPAADLYGVGVILYEMLTGQTPFPGGMSGELLERHFGHPVVPPSLRRCDRVIPIALERAILIALDHDPTARFSTALAFASALRIPVPAEPAIKKIRTGAAGSGAFSTEAPTSSWACDGDIASEDRRPRLAAGSRPGGNERIRVLRGEIANAVGRGAGDEAIAGVLEVARIFVDQRALWAARAELEDMIDVLTGGSGVDAGPTPPALWRLLLTLAALYSGLHDPIRARRTALAAHRHAVRHDSEPGRERAAMLIARLCRP
jgi:protein kinase-like protein